MINRRTTLRGITGGLLGSALTLPACDGPKSQSVSLSLDPNNSNDLHYMHRKLAYRLDDGLTYWNIEALRMGFRDGILTPFWKLHAGIIYNTKTLDDYRYGNNAILKIFYTDLETGKLLEKFNNPYTGETVTAKQPGLYKAERVFGLTGIEHPVGEKNDRVFRNDAIGPASIEGDDIWLNGDSIMRSEPPNRRNRLVQVNDWSTYHGSMSELVNPDINSARATHTFNDLNTFNHSWIGMDGVKDVWSISRGFGRKSETVDGLPENWRKMVAQTDPQLLTDDPGF